MQLFSVTASPELQGFATMSKYFFTAALSSVVAMTLNTQVARQKGGMAVNPGIRCDGIHLLRNQLSGAWSA